ncbi:hypothetical protein AQUCO_00600177v1 [Aquilegia coerulea]|uniref:MULE transposase domain-containing protein n=1 Tax=Aquilegia coerulea TaxID=218851 RepID=A0A2G5ENA1_AQUCA|nr:hypothetical protein AQUCO_00600177v1 [Aquilegia coerulea]
MTVAKSDTIRYSAHCSEDGCDFYILASAVHGVEKNFVIKKFIRDHSCGLMLRDNYQPQMSRELVMSSILRHLKDKPSLTPKDIQLEMLREFGINGDEAESYSHLVSYMKTLKESDPGGHMVLEIDEKTRKFNRLFIAFEACIYRFTYCRPLLLIDACHLKTKFKGCMMAATGRNVDDGFYPFAFAVVSTGENDDNWCWFLENLKVVVSLQRPITFISDRHSSLLKYVPQYNDLLVGSKENQQDVLDFVSQTPFEHWANAHFPGCRYGDMCSGIAESFNSWIGEERFLPITSLLNKVRIKLMNQFSERRVLGNGWNFIICPKIEFKLKERIDAGKTWSCPNK